jgi:hypothetical protein
MKRILLLAPLILAACGAHYDPCKNPCPETVPAHLCECRPFQGGGAFNPPAVTPDVKPDPKPETPKPPSKPDHPKPEARAEV